MAQGVTHHLGAVVQVQLVEQMADVELDGVLAHSELLGELAVGGHALDQQLEDLPLALGQGVGVGRRRRGRRLGRAGEFLEQLAGDRRRQGGLAALGALEQSEEILGVEVLEQVALGA